MPIELLVEGYTDEIFLKKCLGDLGYAAGNVYGKRGVSYVMDKAAGFAVRGEFSPILILADLMDLGVACAAEGRQLLVPEAPRFALVRLAVPELESWMIASKRELADFFGISVTRIPTNGDVLEDPKRELINLARASNRARIQSMFVPRAGVSSVVGTGYVEGIAEFMSRHWRLAAAADNSASFSRFVERVTQTFAGLEIAL